MKRQKTPSFWAMLKKSFFRRFLPENGMKRNSVHAAETRSSTCFILMKQIKKETNLVVE